MRFERRVERPLLRPVILISIGIHVAIVAGVAALARAPSDRWRHAAPAAQGRTGGASGIARRADVADRGLALTQSEALLRAGNYLMTGSRGQSFLLSIEPVNESGPSRDFWTLIADDPIRRSQPLKRVSDSVFAYPFHPAISITFLRLDDSAATMELRVGGESFVGMRDPIR